MKLTLMIIGGVLLFVLVLSVLLGLALLRYVVKPKNETLEYTRELEQSRGFLGDYETYEQVELNIPTEEGYILHGILFPNSEEKFVIVSHGYTANHLAAIKYANIYYELGYSVYIYDLRNHGSNEPIYCSMGQWESRDILTITKFLRQNFGEDISIGLHGESLGAASSILALGEDTSYSFCVSDCGFSDLGVLLEDLSGKILHLPAKLSHLASLACKIKYGYRLDQIRPVDAFKKNNTTPVLFIHGKDDRFIVPSHCERFYQAARGKKEIQYFDHARHASSYGSNPPKYRKTVQEFLRKLD